MFLLVARRVGTSVGITASTPRRAWPTIGRMMTDADRYVAVSVAAYLTGVPVRTLRRWVAAGHIAAIDGQRGRLVDVESVRTFLGSEAATATNAATNGQDAASGRQVAEHGREPADNGREPADNGRMVAVDDLGELVQLLREKDQTILELSGRCGYLMAELEQARQTIKLLSASADNPQDCGITDQAPVETAPTTTPAPVARPEPSQAPPRPWWARVWGVLKLPERRPA